MDQNKIKFINLINLINATDNLEYHNFINYITTNYIYFYQFISAIKNNKLILNKIIKMLNINYEFFIQTIETINSTFKINRHKKEYSHEYYLIIICQLLNNHNQWVSLKFNILANNINKYHYKSINKQFILYSKKDIFKNTFYNTTINNNLITNNNDLLIDASMMSNKMGSENVSINCEYTKKNCTKLSFISNTDKIILSITPYDINNKEIDYEQLNLIKKQKKELKEHKKNKSKKLINENKELKIKLKNILNDENNLKNKINSGKKCKNDINEKFNNKIDDKIIIKTKDDIKIICKLDEKIKDKNETIKINTIKTSIHDVMMIQTSLNNIKTKFINKKKITLTGDLGYLSSKTYKLNNENILLITPKRKNQKNKNSEFESIKLRSRYKIENCFGLLKQYERITLRKDRKMNTFMSFIYIACAIENNKIIKKQDKNQ